MLLLLYTSKDTYVDIIVDVCLTGRTDRANEISNDTIRGLLLTEGRTLKHFQLTPKDIKKHVTEAVVAGTDITVTEFPVLIYKTADSAKVYTMNDIFVDEFLLADEIESHFQWEQR